MTSTTSRLSQPITLFSKREASDAEAPPPIVSRLDWEAAREQLLTKEKAVFRDRDALAAERRRMPWLAMEKAY